MGSLSPIAIALIVVVVMTLVGLIVSHLRDRGTFAGYEEIAGEARHVSKTLKGELFRDGSDLVVSGNYLGLPTVVRFSYAENTPGMNIRMSAPATFTLSVVPKGAQATEGRVLVRTADDMFDAKFTSRSDHPNQAKIFLGGKTVGAALKKLCCSQKTFFTMTTGSFELSELVIPEPYTAHHIIDHIESLRRLATAAAEMPGAHTVTIKKIEKEKAIAGRIAIAVGVVAAIIVVVGATREFGNSANAGPVDAGSASFSQGVLPVDAPLISRLGDFHTAGIDDLDPSGVGWLRQSRDFQPGRIPGNYSGQNSPRDVAYLLVRPDGTRRVVLLANGENVFDAEYKALGFIARVPQERIASVPWQNPKFTASPTGDGLLVVRNAQDPASAQLFFLSSSGLVSANPKNYQQVSLE